MDQRTRAGSGLMGLDLCVVSSASRLLEWDGFASIS